MLIELLNTTPHGAMWADARACGAPAMADGHAVDTHAAPAAHVSMKHRSQAAASRGSYGIGVSNGTRVFNGTIKRPEGLRGRTG